LALLEKRIGISDDRSFFDRYNAAYLITFFVAVHIKIVDPENRVAGVSFHAVSINAADYQILRMGFPPKNKIFGADISGIVESAGKNVNSYKLGD